MRIYTGVVGMILLWRKAIIISSSLVLLTCTAAAQSAPAPAAGVARAPAVLKAPPAARHKRRISKPSPVPEPPQPPPPPPTPEQMPPTPPQVTYSNGLLTIVANNSTLSDILHAVSARTGADVDMPPQLGAQRVAAHIGPGAPRDVLSDLLSGPGFDYILLGSDGDPNAVRSIILSPNQPSSPNAGPSVAQRQPVRAVTPPQEEIEDEAAGEAQFQPENPQNVRPVPPPQQTFGPGQPLPPNQTAGQQAPFGGGQQPQVKTPEQLLEELRKMQQQGNQPQNQTQR